MQNTNNELIGRLPKDVQHRFLDRCEMHDLVVSTELSARGAPLTHAYFPNTGLISLEIDIDNQTSMEVGLVGRESMLGSELLLGMGKAPWRAVVQAAGTCWRIKTLALRQAMAEMRTLQALLQRNLMVRVHQQQALASVTAGRGGGAVSHSEPHLATAGDATRVRKRTGPSWLV